MLKDIFALTIVTFAMCSDIRSGKIPNSLCAVGLVSGIICTVILNGWQQLKESIIGMLIPLILLFWMYVIKALGAGDIKLLSAMGAFVGTNIWKIIATSMVIAAVFASVIIGRKIIKKIKDGNTKCSQLLICVMRSRTKIYYSIPIFCAYILYMGVKYVGVDLW